MFALGGNEWLIVLLIFGSLAVIVSLFILALRGSTQSRTPSITAVRVSGSAADVLRDLQLAVAGCRNIAVRRDTADSLTARWHFVPVWAIAVAVLFFPFGLIALLARKTTDGTVVTEQQSDQVCLMRMGGEFSKDTIRAVNWVIESRS